MIDWKQVKEKLLQGSTGGQLPPSIQLPYLPKALTEFVKRAKDPDATVDELAKIISSDVGLTTELLKTVNSSIFGLTKKVNSVQQALVIMGAKKTLLHLTTCGMKQMASSCKSKLIHLQSFWNSNLERALFAKEMARILRVDQELAFTAGMLQDFLLPILTDQLCEDYLEYSENYKEWKNLIEFENAKFGWNHAQAAAQMLLTWEFPDELICCILCHHVGKSILADPMLDKSSVAVVAMSAFSPEQMLQEPNGMDTLIALNDSWPNFDLGAVVSTVDTTFQETASGQRHHFSLAWAYENYKQKQLAEIQQ